MHKNKNAYHVIIFLLMLIVWAMASVVTVAQIAQRDYAIEGTEASLSDDGVRLVVTVDLVNNGADGVRESTASLILTDGRMLAESVLPIIAGGERLQVRFEVGVADFPEGFWEGGVFTPEQTLALRVEAGVDLYELAGTGIARDNVSELSYTIPHDAPAWGVGDDGRIWLNGEGYTTEDLAPLLGLSAVVLVVVWLMSVIFRLIFRREPAFGTWQPPYATAPTLHPDSVAGRRQAWQQHAQNGLILSPPHEGVPYAVKNLLGQDGRWLDGWRVVALRCAQYDQYGRVTRTQYVAPQGVIRRLNQVMPAFGTPRFEKRLKGIARLISKEARRRFGKKMLFLPVALDMRWEGAGGQVRIQFQLYQGRGGHWVLLDTWYPQMIVMPARFQEQTTYTIHGQTSGETPREYFQRLEHDMVWLLAQTFNPRLPEPVATASETGGGDDAPTYEPSYDVPDTLSNMQPVDMGDAPPNTPLG